MFVTCAAFRGYRFAESHAHACAQHACACAWMRQHYPAAHLAAFLSKALGLWPASTVGHEARRVPQLQRDDLRAENGWTVRLPHCVVEGMDETAARQTIQERLTGGKYTTVEDFYDRVEIRRDALDTLAKAGAFDAVDAQKDRREAHCVLHTIANAHRPGTRGLLILQTAPPEPSALAPDELLFLDLKAKGLLEFGQHPLDAHWARLSDLGCVLRPGIWAPLRCVQRRR